MTHKTNHIGDTNKMVTAVEWLVDSIWKGELALHQKVLIEQAKQMEKEQIIKAFNQGTFSEMEKIDAEEYYNETYKNDLSDNTRNNESI